MPDVFSKGRWYRIQKVVYTNVTGVLKNHLSQLRSNRFSCQCTPARRVIDSNTSLQMRQQKNNRSLLSAFKKTWQKLQAEMKIEFPYNFPAQLHMRDLILSHGHVKLGVWFAVNLNVRAL